MTKPLPPPINNTDLNYNKTNHDNTDRTHAHVHTRTRNEPSDNTPNKPSQIPSDNKPNHTSKQTAKEPLSGLNESTDPSTDQNTHTTTHEAIDNNSDNTQTNTPSDNGNNTYDNASQDTTNKTVHAIAQHDLKDIVESLTAKQSKYVIARLVDPSWPLKACSRIASLKTSSTQTERGLHVARILKAAKANRLQRLETSQREASMSRQEILGILAEIIRDEDNRKLALDAIKQYRELEDLDKSQRSTVNQFQVLLASLPSNGMLLPSESPSATMIAAPSLLPNATPTHEGEVDD